MRSEVLPCSFKEHQERTSMTHHQSNPDGANDLVARFAERYGFREDELLNTLAQTAFRQQNGNVPTREQMLSLLTVADRKSSR